MAAINTNTGALMARAYSSRANHKIRTAMERLSSGVRVNSAADDAAGLAVSLKMTNAIRSYGLGVRNTHDMVNLLQRAESSLEEITKILVRIRELAGQSANGVYTARDREKIELELYSLVDGIDSVAVGTRFNGVKLLDGTFIDTLAQTGKDFGDHVDIKLDGFLSSNLGAVWESDIFENGEFDNETVTEIAPDVYTIPGWEIHNKRVELGEDGSEGPANIFNRDGVEVANLIGGWATPEDPTPRPFNNSIDLLVSPAVSSTTSDPALTYDTTYNGIVDPSPPDASDPGTWDIVTGPMTSVTISGPSTTDKQSLMGQTLTGVEGSVAGHLGDNAIFNVTIGPMTATQSSGLTTDNSSMMGQTYTNVAGTGPAGHVGADAEFTVVVGPMTVTQNPATSSTNNLGMMGQTYTNVAGTGPAGHVGADAEFTVTIGEMSITPISGATTDNSSMMGRTFNGVEGETAGHLGDNAEFTVTVGPMTVTPTEGTTTNNTSMMGQTYSSVSGTGPAGHVGSNAEFTVTVGAMSITPTEGTANDNPAMMGRTFTEVSGTGPAGHVGDAAEFTVTVAPMAVTITSGGVTADGERLGRSYTGISAEPPSAGAAGDQAAVFDVNISAGGNITVVINDAGEGYVAGESIRILGSLIGGDDGVDDLVMSVDDSSVSVTLTDPGSGYTTGDIITIPGTSIGGDAGDYVKVRVGDATVNVTLTDSGSGYTTGDIITILGTSIGGNADDFVKVRVGDANINVTLTEAGSGYSSGDTITIPGESIGGDADGSDDVVVQIGAADINVTMTDSGSDYTAGDVITIPGTSIGGGAGDFVEVTVNSASVTATMTSAGSGYTADDVITIPGTSINGSDANDIAMTVNNAQISISLTDPGTSFKITEEITILGSEIGGVDGEDDFLVVGNTATITATATSGLGYNIGDNVSLNGADLAVGASDVVTVIELVPPGTDDSSRPSGFGNIESDSDRGFAIDDGTISLNTGTLDAVAGYDIVHGPYMISEEAKYIEAGEKLFFDWKASGINDAFDVFAYLLNVDTGETQILLDETQEAEGVSTDWVTQETTVLADGNYKYVFINGSYDATGGKKLGAEMFVDNIYIARQKLPSLSQNTIDVISLLTAKEANNATSIADLAISQVSLERAKIGALINRLTKAAEMSSITVHNMKVARSRISDSEYTKETSDLAKQQILQLSAQAMLAQANLQKHLIVDLLQT